MTQNAARPSRSREQFLTWAREGRAIPLAVDLLIHSDSTPDKVYADPAEMSRVMVLAAERFGAPMAVAPMDLRVEKAWLADLLGEEDAESFSLSEPLDEEAMEELDRASREAALSARMGVTCDAIRRTAEARPDLLTSGMCIGPFSLLTKCLPDLITAVYMSSMGMTGEDDASIALMEQMLPVAVHIVRRYAAAQAQAGARAIIVCEPAANIAYVSPNAMESDPEVFGRVITGPNAAVRDAIEGAGAELILHDCGELTPAMIEALAALRPAMLSLGGSVDLPEAAPLVPDDVVLFGNIPSKFFPSEADMPLAKVEAMCGELLERMRATGHPFILGSECDILAVPGKEGAIAEKAACIARHSAGTGCC